jgi:site-specific DNA recombinase
LKDVEEIPDGLLSAAAVRDRSAALTRRISDLEERIGRALGTSPVVALADADDVRAAWQAMPLIDRKQVVDLLMTVTILPAGKGQRFTPAQVQVEWKTS